MVILRHIPPKAGISGEGLEAAGLQWTYRPDYFVSGHDHASLHVWTKAGTKNWTSRVCSCRGQSLSAPIPNYIKLDTESGELSWHTTSETRTPEEGLYDHLVLKLAKIEGSVAARPDGLLLHENIFYSLFPLHVGMRQYWRDFESLERFTRAEPHREWWKQFVCGVQRPIGFLRFA